MKRGKDHPFAAKHSKNNPDITVYVMINKGKETFLCMSDWLMKELLSEKCKVIATYKNGNEI